MYVCIGGRLVEVYVARVWAVGDGDEGRYGRGGGCPMPMGVRVYMFFFLWRGRM